MPYINNITCVRTALTLAEMIIAMAIMAIVFAVVLPQFEAIRNSWNSKAGAAETLQNGRVLTEHMYRNLSTAVKVSAVSDSSETNGYIEFENNDGDNLRYDVNSTSNYVEFGQTDDLSDLAGPVSQLLFTCYDINDLDTPITDVNSIRFVKAEIIFTKSDPSGRDKTFIVSAHLRTNWNSATSGLVGWWKLDETTGFTAADSSGNQNDGTLTNMSGNEWTTGILGGALEFDGYNDYVDLPIDSVIGSLTDCTISTWVNWSGQGSDWQRIWDFGTGQTYNMYLTPNTNSNRLCFAITLDSWFDEDQTASSEELTTGWHHIAVVIDPDNNKHTLYFDGEVEAENTSARYTPSDLGNTNQNWLGRSQYIADPYFDGLLDEVRIYNRVLEPADIAQLADVLRYREFTEAKTSSDTTSITISTPDSNEGDLLIAAVATDGDTSSSLAPPGGEDWTEIDIDDYSGQVTLGAWWKLADASESSSHQFTWTGNEQAYAWMMRITGHKDSNPINDYSYSGESSSTPTSPEVTSTLDYCLILRLGAFDDDEITEDDPGLWGHTAITMDKSGSSGTEGLVGYWNMDESSGTTAADSSGNKNDGTLMYMNPTYDWVTGQIGNALDFDGYNDYVSLPIGSVINSLRNCTFAIWVNWDSSSSWERIWDFGTGTTYYMFLTPKNSVNNRMRFAITTSGNGSEEQTTAPSALSSYGWHHVTVTINADYHTHKLYLDGSPVAQNYYGYHEPDDLGYTNKNYLAKSNFTADPYFNGRLDDFRIYNFTLSPEEVDELAQWSGSSSGMVSGGAGYTMQLTSGDSGTSNFSLDSSNQAQTLTIAIAPNLVSEGGGGGINP